MPYFSNIPIHTFYTNLNETTRKLLKELQQKENFYSAGHKENSSVIEDRMYIEKKTRMGMLSAKYELLNETIFVDGSVGIPPPPPLDVYGTFTDKEYTVHCE